MRVHLLHKDLDLPDGVPLLKGLESLHPRGIARILFCRKGECGSCKLWYRTPDDPSERKGRGCSLLPLEGMEITVISPELKVALKELLG